MTTNSHNMRKVNNRSLANGLEILQLYDSSTAFLTIAEISEKLGYSQSKTYRLAKTLTDYNFLRKEAGTKQYSLGINTIRLGLLAQKNLKLSAIARSSMEELSGLTKETVFLTAINGTKIVVFERVESKEPIRYASLRSGQTYPLTSGAPGKVLMAYLEEEKWDRIIAKEGLKRNTPHTITDLKRLKKQLKEIRKKGYAYSDQEVELGVRGVAGPIRNSVGEVVASLSIAGPVYRMNDKKINELIKVVVKYSQKISSEIQGT